MGTQLYVTVKQMLTLLPTNFQVSIGIVKERVSRATGQLGNLVHRRWYRCGILDVRKFTTTLAHRTNSDSKFSY